MFLHVAWKKLEAEWKREMQINTPREEKAMAHPLPEAGTQTALALPAGDPPTLATPCPTMQILWVRTGAVFVTHLQKNGLLRSMSNLTMTARPMQPIITSPQAI